MKTKLLVVALLLSLITACATFGDRTVNVSESQLQQKLNERLAVPISLLKVFDVNLSNSQVRFDKTSGRMFTTMDAGVTSHLLGKNLAGKLGISGKLRFDAPSSAVVLDDTKIEQFDLGNGSGKYGDLVNALAKSLGGEALNGLTLYTVKPEDLKINGTQYAPKDMQITDRGLQITLSPVR